MGLVEIAGRGLITLHPVSRRTAHCIVSQPPPPTHTHTDTHKLTETHARTHNADGYTTKAHEHGDVSQIVTLDN